MNTEYPFISLMTESNLSDLIERSVEKALSKNSEKKNESDSDENLDINQAALYTKYAVDTIYGKTCRNKIPFKKPDGKLIFSKKELSQWLDQQKNKSRVG